MSDNNSIINLGNLTKPATILIEKVSNAVGVVFEPKRIVRKALAEKEAKLIKAQADRDAKLVETQTAEDIKRIKAVARMDLSDVENRGIERFVQQEARKQRIIESITAQAANELPESAKTNELDEDWVAHFFKQCDTVSDKEMQSLWARLLVGEATAPGSFSKRTVNFISTIDKKDATLFTAFCQFVWNIQVPCPLIYAWDIDIYNNHGVTFETLRHLDAIGLISLDTTVPLFRMGLPKILSVSYFESEQTIEFPFEENNQLEIGLAIFTQMGLELFSIAGATANQEFFGYIINRWIREVKLQSRVDDI